MILDVKELRRYHLISGRVKREYGLWALERIGLSGRYLVKVVEDLSELGFRLEILIVCDFCGVSFLNPLFFFLAHQ